MTGPKSRNKYCQYLLEDVDHLTTSIFIFILNWLDQSTSLQRHPSSHISIVFNHREHLLREIPLYFSDDLDSVHMAAK